jgi:hypothetical protein
MIGYNFVPFGPANYFALQKASVVKANLNTSVDTTECRTEQGSSQMYVIGLYPVRSSGEQHGSTAEEGGLALCVHGGYVRRNYCDLRCS